MVIRIADWWEESVRTGEPAFDVECYVHGVYDWNESKSFTKHSGLTKRQAKEEAVAFARNQLGKFLLGD